MTTSVSNRRAGPFLGNGVTTTFPFTFKIANITASPFDIRAYQTSFVGVQTELVYGTRFAVTLNLDQNTTPGGTVEYRVAGVATPLPSGEKLTLKSDSVEDQQTDLVNGGSWNPTVVENSLDKLTFLIQELQESFSRTLSYPVSDTTAGAELPTAVARANKLFSFDASGNPTITNPGDTGLALIAYVDAADAAISANLSAHAADASLHLTASQNALLDGLTGTLTAAELNFVDGVTSPVQAQLDNKQTLDATLTALAAHNTNGLLAQTAADTFAGRTIVAGAGVSVANGDGVAGNPTISSTITQYTDEQAQDAVGNNLLNTASVALTYNDATGQMSADVGQIAESQVTNLVSDLAGKQPLDGTLTALAAFNTNGLLVQTAADTFAGRAVAAGAGISVANGDGVAGNPTVSSTITQYTDEQAQDAVGLNLLDTASVNLTYNDTTGQISADVLSPGVDHNSLANLTTGDPHTQYVKKAGDTMTGLLTTQALAPDTDNTRDLGAVTLRYREINAIRLKMGLITGPGTFTVTNGNLIGNIVNDGSGSPSITANGATGLIRPFVVGHISKPTGAGSPTISNTGSTALVGRVFAATPYPGYGTSNASISVTGVGGACFATIDTGYGDQAGTVTHSANGGFTSAFTGAGGAVTNSGSGSFCSVFANVGATATASASGSFISGFVQGAGLSIQATANGAFAQGTSTTTSIIASAINAAQFGPGTNAQPDSLSVGTGIRIKGTTGAPVTPRDGDLWVASTAVNIRTVGVNLNLNRPTVTGSRATPEGALKDLLVKLSTMNVILDSSTL